MRALHQYVASAPAFWPIVAYLVSGTLLTIYNKWLLTKDDSRPHLFYGFPFPVTLILVHMVSTSLFALGLCLVVPSLRAELRRVRAVTSRRAYLKRYLPIGVLSGLDILLTNVGFRISSVALVEIVKSGNILIVCFVSIFRGKERGSPAKIAAVLTLALGIALAKKGDVDSNAEGFMAALGALAAASIRLLAMEYLLHQGTDKEPGSSPGSAVSSSSSSGSGSGSNAPYTRLQTLTSVVGEDDDDLDDLEDDDLDDEALMDAAAAEDGFPRRHHNSQVQYQHRSQSVGSGSGVGDSVFRSERHGGMHPTVFLLHWAPVAAAALVPSWLAFERAPLLEYTAHPPADVAGVLFVGAVMALVLNISELQLLQRTNVVSMGVISVVKLVVVIFSTIWLFQGGSLRLVNQIGVFVSLGGVIGYQIVKVSESRRSDASVAGSGHPQQVGRMGRSGGQQESNNKPKQLGRDFLDSGSDDDAGGGLGGRSLGRSGDLYDGDGTDDGGGGLDDLLFGDSEMVLLSDSLQRSSWVEPLRGDSRAAATQYTMSPDPLGLRLEGKVTINTAERL